MSNETSNKLIKGAAILGMAGIVIKFLGAFFRIPLTNWMGDTGMAYYAVAYNVYSVFLVLSTAGIPVAISKMVSERIAVKNYGGAHKVFKVSFFLLFALGIISFAICFFGAEYIAGLFKIEEAAMSLKAIAPALFFVPLFSAFRGYFQGRQNMNPTAVSEICEQLIRVIVGLSLSYAVYKTSLINAAAGATFGASAGSIAGLAIIFVIYMLNRRVIHTKIEKNPTIYESTRSILWKILAIAVPIVLGAEIWPIMNNIDTAIIVNRMTATGWSLDEAKSLYGVLTGFCNSLIAFPQVFTQAVAISLVPAISSAFAQKDGPNVVKNVQLGMRTTMIMGFPCAFGIFALAEPILLLLYPKQAASAMTAAPTLMLMSISVIFLAVAQTQTGVLQGIGKQVVPVKNLLIGVLVKVAVTWILVGIPKLNINGAVIGTMVAYVIALLLNQRDVKKYTGAEFDFMLTYVKPCLAAGIMGVTAFGAHKLLMMVTRNSIATLGAIMVGVVVYVIMIFMVKAITKEELKTMPKGEKIVRLLDKFIK